MTSPERLESMRRYRKSEQGRATIAAYNASDHGKAVRNAGARVYRQSIAGKAKMAALERAARQRKRDRIAAIKLECGCVDCGYNIHASALEFDHLPGSVKCFSIGEAIGRAWSAIEAEIAKCEVVCANCHRIRTHVDRKTA